MIELDETALIGFFGVLPESSSPEEAEFFGTLGFEVEQGDFQLTISVGRYEGSLFLRLKHKPTNSITLAVNQPGLQSVQVENLADGRAALLCRAVSHVRTATSERAAHTVSEWWIELVPAISVRVETQPLTL